MMTMMLTMLELSPVAVDLEVAEGDDDDVAEVQEVGDTPESLQSKIQLRTVTSLPGQVSVGRLTPGSRELVGHEVEVLV